MIFNKRLERLVIENPKLANNSDVDNNNIMLILMISYFFKVVKLVIFILIVSYFMGMLWYIYCELTHDDTIVDPKGEDLGFILKWNLDQKSNLEKAIIVTYWAFTTLSTVGFGDFYPISNPERLLCAFILLFGVTIFSYIMGNYIMILNSMQALNADFDDGENLSKWLGLIKRFNNGRPVSIEYKDKIEKYFDYRWINDKNQAVSTEEDQQLIEQLPSHV